MKKYEKEENEEAGRRAGRGAGANAVAGANARERNNIDFRVYRKEYIGTLSLPSSELEKYPFLCPIKLVCIHIRSGEENGEWRMENWTAITARKLR